MAYGFHHLDERFEINPPLEDVALAGFAGAVLTRVRDDR